MADDRDSGVLSSFLSLKDSENCFRFFGRSGSNAGVYVLGWWATYAAVEYVKSEAVLKTWTSSSGVAVPVVVLNDTLCKEVIADCLLRRGASVEFYDKNVRGVYECVQRGSPGNITDFEATLFEQEEAAVQLMASGSLYFPSAPVDSSVKVGLASLNTTLRQITVSEYHDSIQLVDLDVLLSQTSVKELLVTVPATATEAARLKEPMQAVRRICDRLRITLTVQSTKESQQTGNMSVTVEALRNLLRVPEERRTLLELHAASRAAEELLRKMDINDPNNQRAFYLKHVMPSTFVKLDSAAVEALHLFSLKPDPKGMAPSSVFGWLNRCFTGMGSRVLRQWLLQPLRNVSDIVQRQSMVEVLVANTLLRDALITEVLRRCGDMDRLNRKLMRRRLALKDTKAFLQFVDVLPACVTVLRMGANGERHSKLLVDEYIAPLEEISEHVKNLRLLIESSVDFSDRIVPRINAAFDDDLAALRDQLTTVQNAVEKEYAVALKRYEWSEKTMKVENHPSYGYVFRVSRKEDRQLRAAKDLITLSTSKDGVRFVSNNLSALSSQYKQISEEYERRQEALKQKLVDTIASYLPLLDDAKELLASLDVFVSLALVVREAPRPMVCPRITAPVTRSSAEMKREMDEPVLQFMNLRHPLVELRQPHYHANSLELTHESNGMIITGPNMGGKSTFMRSVGVAVVLAQIGCFVPADAATVCVRDAVMCRVGATDHLSQGVSTFMVEMLESAAILTHATSQSLAIVDELGRGTSTYDGFGLAWAIAKEISCSIRATMLFSTHFHEMTELPAAQPELRNYHFGADVNEKAGTLQFLYALEPGPCGQSYGLYVASLAQMPKEVIDSARRKAAVLESFDSSNSTDPLGCARIKKNVHRITADPAACQRVREYAQRVRSASEDDNKEMLKRIRAEVVADPVVGALLE